MATAARSTCLDDGADEDAADLAEAEVIQQAAEDCLHCMLSQPASQLGVQALDDLSLPQQDLDCMKYKSAEYVILDLEVGSGIDDEEGGGSESDGQSDGGDSPGPGGRGRGSGAQDDGSDGNDGNGSDDHGNSGREPRALLLVSLSARIPRNGCAPCLLGLFFGRWKYHHTVLRSVDWCG
ncbi:hypothetical protein Aspvir_004137 [Aspergillus viridinutans]|uniref:Uncharacterized protein n=1 Tax=Aspergillus viridinutans TaxID=75553 RepID=A0A9P3F0B1_ASPVI|nr:uncharacterized protein Aspvir_004137 [Aspergillus viridinutans]GIK00119.1 hypothetical protein Aspvir_004137 [Aspergillus viridinutans]